MIVLKPFTSHNRRFAAGAEVSAADDIAPHTLANLQARGFVGDPNAPAKKAAAPKAED